MFLLVDKPKGITSHDVVHRTRKITGEKKIGHAGTLDPNATGLLIGGIGRDSTRKLGQITKDTRKEYRAIIYLGETRDTDDVEGKVISKKESILPPSLNIVQKTLDSFKGEQDQMPPKYSALKIDGKKAYELARKGKEIKLKKRRILIHSIKLIEYEYPSLKIEVSVSSGTYIRALARDIGEKLDCGAYLKNLRRTRIGEYEIKDAVKLGELTIDNWRDFTFEID